MHDTTRILKPPDPPVLSFLSLTILIRGLVASRTNVIQCYLSSILLILISWPICRAVHVLMFFIHAILGVPRVRDPGVVPWMIYFSRQLPVTSSHVRSKSFFFFHRCEQTSFKHHATTARTQSFDRLSVNKTRMYLRQTFHLTCFDSCPIRLLQCPWQLSHTHSRRPHNWLCMSESDLVWSRYVVVLPDLLEVTLGQLRVNFVDSVVCDE